MSSTINASSAGIVETADSSGTLQLQTGGQSALYIDASQNITIPKNLTVQGTLTFSGGGGGAVTTVSGGSTGLTPSTPSSGNVVLGGTLLYSSGGTGLTSTGSSGNVLVSTGSGWSSSTLSTAGIAALASPTFTGTVGAAAITATGTITANSNFYSSSNTVSLGLGSPLVSANTLYTQFFPNTDNYLTLGSGGNRWSTVYAASSTINTSDANEKQQIADLSVAEKAVSQALKGMMKTFKFNDAVQAKGANARIHFGVIAQDVQAAFAAQGLNPNNYGVFCSDTWYEVNGQTHDAEGMPYTKDSSGAVEVTRLGVRYDELFALIIAGL